MAGENVVASGAIAVNLTLNDPQGAMTGGATPSAPGAGGRPAGGSGGRAYTGFLSPEQREELKLARQQQEYAKEQSEYNRLVKKELPAEKEATSSIKKFLPMLGGVFGIAAIAHSSKVVQGTMGAVGQLLGALVDIFLIPFIPLIAKTIGILANIVGGIASFINDPLGFIEKTWDSIFAYAKKGWDTFWKDLLPNIARGVNPFSVGGGDSRSTSNILGNLLKGASGGAGLGAMAGLGAAPFTGGASLAATPALMGIGATGGALAAALQMIWQDLSAKSISVKPNQANITNYITVGDRSSTTEEQIRSAAKDGTKKAFEGLDWMKFAFSGF